MVKLPITFLLNLKYVDSDDITDYDVIVLLITNKRKYEKELEERVRWSWTKYTYN